MRRKLAYLLLAVAVLLMSGCHSIEKIKNIKVTSASLQSVTPTGLRSLDVVALLGIDNPAMQFTVEDISGVLYRKGEPYVDFTIEPITIKARTAGVYELHASAALRPEIPLLSVLALAKDYDLAEFTYDITATVKLRSGVGKVLTFKDMSVKDLLD